MSRHQKELAKEESAFPPMPFNEALKRVWAAPPMPKTKAKPAAKTANTKPAK